MLGAGPTALPSVDRSDPRFGVVQAYEAPAMAAVSGAHWERLIFYWSQMQPNGPGDFQPPAMGDGVIDAEVAAGMELVGVVLGTPRWAGGAANAVPANLDLPFDDPRNNWGQFTGRLAARYQGRVDTWVIWNEPDVEDPASPYHFWAGSAQDYYRLVKFAVTLEQQAAYVVQALALGVAAGAERIAVYKLSDLSRDFEGPFGLARRDLSPRPAFLAYQTAVAYLAHAQSASWLWDNATQLPTPAQVDALLDSNANRFQWIWPASWNRVVVARAGGQRITVVWNSLPTHLSVDVTASAPGALAVDKFGAGHAITASGGVYHLTLPTASANVDARDPTIYLVGGDPLILVEEKAAR